VAFYGRWSGALAGVRRAGRGALCRARPQSFRRTKAL